MKNVSNILVLILKRVGEILVTTPAIRSLRKAYPNAKITVVIDKDYEDVLSGNPNIDKLFLLYSNGSIKNLLKSALILRSEKYDITIDFLANPRSAFITMLVRSPIRIGLKKRIRRIAYNYVIRPFPDVTSYIAGYRLNALRLLNKKTDGTFTDFFITEQAEQVGKEILIKNGIREDDIFITISPVSLQKYKLWSFENYAKVADYILEKHSYKVVLVCGPAEFNFLEKVKSYMKYQPAAMIDFNQLKVFGYVLKRSILHLSNDGGIKHLASAVRTPTITIFGHVNAKRWNEENDPLHIALCKNIDCRKFRCYRNCKYNFSCLNLIEFQDVKRSIDLLLNKIVKV